MNFRLVRRRGATLIGAGALVMGALAIPLGVGSAAQAAQPSIDYACNLQPFDSDFAYATGATITASGTGNAIKVTVQLDSMPGVSPAPLPDVELDGSLSATIGGVTSTLTGTSHVTVPASTAIPMPAVSATVNTSAAAAEVVIGDFTLSMPAFSMSIDCAADEPVDFGSVTITRGPSAACTAAQAAVTSAQAAVTSASGKVAADKASITSAKAKVTKATKAAKKAKKAGKAKKKAAKKKLAATKKALTSANTTLAADTAKLATANASLSRVNGSVKANC